MRRHESRVYMLLDTKNLFKLIESILLIIERTSMLFYYCHLCDKLT